jgi:2-iminobutanoate/2-iminopropanoate deaminase
MNAIRSERIYAEGVPELGPQSLSNCKRIGPQVFISGMLAWDKDQKPLGGNSAYEQARIVFSYMKALMEAAGGRMDDIVKITMFTTDMRHQPAIWQARREFFSGDFPCSTLVQVTALFRPELVIEIEAVGFIGSSGGGAGRA